MVTFMAQGRMGNFLFECATTIAYALDHDMDFTVPPKAADNFWNPVYLKHLVNPNYNPHLGFARVTEMRHNYQDLLFDESFRKTNVLLVGYFQTEKYFKHRREEILKAFGYKWEWLPRTVSVHVRRGDYLIHTNKHPEVKEEWYEEAMSKFPYHHFIFFSDEIEWCRQAFADRTDCSFSTGKSIEEDLVLMSCCSNHINSSSTYSWWGAWLNQNPDKIIITPKLWFTPGWDNCNVDDIIPENWIKL